MNNPSNFESKLKKLEPDIIAYIDTLKSENLKLKKKIGQLEAYNISLKDDIILLTEENAQKIEHKKHLQSSSPEELIKNMRDRLNIRKNLNKKKKP